MVSSVVSSKGCRAPGMPEAGYIPIPKKLAARGVKDMVRISDARMSGTAYGTVVLHAAPEAAVGGPLALVQDGDLVSLSVAERRIDLCVDEAEMARRNLDHQLGGPFDGRDGGHGVHAPAPFSAWSHRMTPSGRLRRILCPPADYRAR